MAAPYSGVFVKVRLGDDVVNGLRIGAVCYDENIGLDVCEVYTAEHGRQTHAAETTQEVDA